MRQAAVVSAARGAEARRHTRRPTLLVRLRDAVGTPVLAARDGIVVASATRSEGGQLAKFKQGQTTCSSLQLGLFSYYHLEPDSVEVQGRLC